MALNGIQLLEGFSQFLGDDWRSTTTGAGNAGGTTILDTKLSRYGDCATRDMYFRIRHACNASDLDVRRSTLFVSSGGTVTVLPAFTALVAACIGYDMHKWDPEEKFRALNQARLMLGSDLFIARRVATVTSDGRNNEYSIPSTIRHGPFLAILEERIGVEDAAWNLVENPRGDVLTSWTAAAGVVATIFEGDDIDDIIPKYNDKSTLLVYTDAGADGTYTQPVADMVSDMSASRVAGRRVEFGWWVHSRDSGPVVELIDDTGTVATSTAHGGSGWEFVSVAGTIATTNATTFSVRIRFPNLAAAAHRRVHVEHAMLAFEQLPTQFNFEQSVEFERDDTTQTFWLRETPPRGTQIQLIGKDTLSAIAESGASTVLADGTNNMEVDEGSAELLYAKAAEYMLGQDLLNSPTFRDIAVRIGVVNQREAALVKLYKQTNRGGRIVSPYAR